MGWDDWTSKFKFEEKPDTDEKDVGLKEFEVEEDVIFTVNAKNRYRQVKCKRSTEVGFGGGLRGDFCQFQSNL